MGSKEWSNWTDDQTGVLLRVLSRPRNPELKMPLTTNPEVEYSKLVSTAELADGVWHRGYPGGKSHEFVTVLINPDKETLKKASRTEVNLQRKFRSVNFDFDLEFFALSEEKKAQL